MLRRFTALLAMLALVAGCSAYEAEPVASGVVPGVSSAPSATATPTPKPQLPGGGRELLPEHRLCGYVGYPGALGQGRLGIGDIDERMAELHQTCAAYAGDRSIMPVMELIAVTVQPAPGPDGMWRDRIDTSIIDQWLGLARQNGAILLLDIQPGQSRFLEELKLLERYLVQPDVGVALDPEWEMSPGQIPMQSFGSTSGEELNQVAAYLSQLVVSNDLPDKAMVYHILHPTIISNESALAPHPGVVAIKSVDGIGAPADKIATYQQIAESTPAGTHLGFKLFYEEDVAAGGALMTPDQVLALSPVPDYVLYE